MIDRFFTERGHAVIVVTHRVDAILETLRKGVDCTVTMGEGRGVTVEGA